MEQRPICSDPSSEDNSSHNTQVPGQVLGLETSSTPEPSVDEVAPMTTHPATRGLNRRSFLRTAAVGMGALAVSACGWWRQTPTPTASPLPSPTGPASLLRTPVPLGNELYLPLVNQQEQAVAALVPQPIITPTPPKPIPTPTPTPAIPTATPTPMATPFPPGPPSKLGLHVMHNHPQMFELLKTKAVSVVKTLELDANFVRQIKETSPNTKVVGRILLPQVELATLDPAAAARSYLDIILPYADDPARRPYFDAWEAYNEPVAANEDEMRRLADFEAERTRMLAERGIRSIIGNFGTGQPSRMELWEYFIPAIQTALEYDGWLGLHEYAAPTIYYLTTRENQGRYPGVTPEDQGWLTLRYRQVYNQFLLPRGLKIPLIFTELGVDGLVAERPGPPDALGWQHFQAYWAENGYGLWGPGAYIEQLVWYDNAMRQNDYVIGGCIYALAASQGWESYDILGPAATVLQQYLTVHAPI
jgi:hypothetical protein